MTPEEQAFTKATMTMMEQDKRERLRQKALGEAFKKRLWWISPILLIACMTAGRWTSHLGLAFGVPFWALIYVSLMQSLYSRHLMQRVDALCELLKVD